MEKTNKLIIEALRQIVDPIVREHCEEIYLRSITKSKLAPDETIYCPWVFMGQENEMNLGTVETAKFSYAGFNCSIVERSDKNYLYQVYGKRDSDDMCFHPEYLFDSRLSLGQIRDICIRILDGETKCKVEIYDQLVVIMGIDE